MQKKFKLKGKRCVERVRKLKLNFKEYDGKTKKIEL